MSTNAITESAWVSEDWELETDPRQRPQYLTIELRRSIHVLPWMRLTFAEGSNSEVKLVFGSHTVIVKGHGLDALLSAVAAQQVIRLLQPTQNEAQFGVRGMDAHRSSGPGIDTISVVPFK